MKLEKIKEFKEIICSIEKEMKRLETNSFVVEYKCLGEIKQQMMAILKPKKRTKKQK